MKAARFEVVPNVETMFFDSRPMESVHVDNTVTIVFDNCTNADVTQLLEEYVTGDTEVKV